MPIPPHVLERLRWSRLSENVKRRLLNAIPGRAYYAVFRAVRREIVIKANQLGIPKERLREHFESLLNEGIPKREIGERMLHDLQQVEELKEATDVEEQRFRNFLKSRPLQAALEEMGQHAEAMRQMQQKAA